MTNSQNHPPEDEGIPNDSESSPSSSLDQTVDTPADATVGMAAGNNRPSPADFVGEGPGDVIGSYRLVRVLGEGGFGAVYEAVQSEPVRRRVALKIIKLGMDTKEVIGRFAIEKQALALMDHPGIAKVFDAGSTDAGRPYFVMELVKGIPVTEYCDRKRLGTRERLHLFMEICAAVQHAHQKGVIHRDLKPSNVLVSDAEGRPTPKVIDFGIAKATSAHLTEKTMFTREAQFIGTPTYMSPEQAGVTALDVDTRSDIYSLGVLLYEMLTGATPFQADDLRSAGFAEIQRIIREEEPPWPSTRARRLGESLTQTAERRRLRGPQLIKKLRGELDWIVMKCLEKDRTRRYETANGLARDVERYLGKEPVAASPPSRTYRLKKLVSRNRTVFAAGAAMVVLLAAGAVGTSIGLVRAKAAEREAVREATKSDQVARFLTDMLAGVGPSAARGRDTEMLEEILQETDENIAVELKGQPEVEGEIRSHLGQTYFELGQYDKAIEQYDLARDLLIEAHGELNGDVARQYSNLGLVYEAQQMLPESEQNHRKALELRRQIYGNENDDTAMNLVNLGNLMVSWDRYAEAEPLLLEGLDLLRKVHGDENENVAICLNSLGNLMQHLGRYNEAGPYYEDALRIHRAVLGDDHPYVLTDMTNIGWLMLNTGRTQEAADRFGETVELSRVIYGEAHPNLIHSLKAHARALQRLDQLEEAEAVFQEALAMAEEVYGPDHPSTADVLNDYATCLTDMDRNDEADAMNQRVLAIQTATLGPDHPSTLLTRINIAYGVYSRGEFLRAIKLYEDVIGLYAEVYGERTAKTASARVNMARALRDGGRLEEAADQLLLAREIRREVLGEGHLMVGVADHDLSLTRYFQGHLPEALDLAGQAYDIYLAEVDTTHHVMGTILSVMARADLDLGEYERAERRLVRGRRLYASARGEDHTRLVDFDVQLARAYSELGELEKAAEYSERVLPRLEDVGPKKRALLQLDLGRVAILAGRFADAERMLLSTYEVYHDEFGDSHHLVRRTVQELLDLYGAWSDAGDARASDELRKWQAVANGG